MNEKLYETLEECLQAVVTGADIEAILKRYPQLADELRPILKTSIQAQSLAATSVPEDAIRRGRARVLQHAAEMRESAIKPRIKRFSVGRLATSLALALIFLISATGLVRASTEALPGDGLYPIKRTWEDMRLLLVTSPEGRESLEDDFKQERLHEVDELLTEGRHETIAFAGLVTEQDGIHWVVAGISVQITPDSKLPADPVTIGASIMVEGRTNIQGFVEADRVELLEPSISLPPFEPVEIEDSGLEYNDNGDEFKAEIDSLKEAGRNGNDVNANDDNAYDSLNNDARKNRNDDSNDNSNSNDDDDDESDEHDGN